MAFLTKNSINVENILKPDKALKSLISMLIPIYINDYGRENKYVINERLKNTAFIFDSDPIATDKFISEHLNEIGNFNHIRKTAREYKDFESLSNKLDKEINKLFESYLESRHYRKILNHDVSVLDLDFDSYSLKSSQLLLNGNDKDREVIEKRRNKYKTDCLYLGIEPVTNYGEIADIEEYRKALFDFKKIELLRSSKWGKRIKREVYTKYGFMANDIDLSAILFDDNPATTAVIRDKDGINYTVVYIPLMKLCEMANLDRILYHELRHVVESTDHSCGIYDFKLGKYDLINEIRTEKHAMEDESYFGDIVFFSKGEASKRSAYELFVSSCENFLDNNHELLDTLAFNGDVETTDTLIGKDYLEKIESQLCDGIIINKSIQKVKKR